MKQLALYDEIDLEAMISSSITKAIEVKMDSIELGNKKELLFLSDACEFLNLSKSTIYALTSSNKIPYYKRAKKLYFKRTELVEWIEEGRPTL